VAAARQSANNRDVENGRPTPATGQTDRLTEERHLLIQALHRYGRHEPTRDPDLGCRCGLQQIYDDLDDNGPTTLTD
jgi:hypothetical protein